MVDSSVVARRLLALTESLRELQRPTAADPVALAADPVLRAAVERWLQVAVEACIDIADDVIASEGWTPPEAARAAFATLAAHGRLPAELASKLGDATALRDILVHDYVSVDLQRLARIVREDLGDLRAFGALVAAWLDGPPDVAR